MALEEVLIGLVVVAIALLIFVLLRLSKSPAAVSDQRIMAIEQNVARMTSKAESLELQTSGLEKGLLSIAQLTAAIKESTLNLPETMAGVSERTKNLPGTAERVAVIDHKLKRLDEFDRKLEEIRGTFLSIRGRGEFGEDAVKRILSAMPDDLWDSQVPLAGGKADFCVTMPNGQWLPIDSKAGGGDVVKEIFEILDELEETENPDEKETLRKSLESSKKALQRKIVNQAKKIEQYAKEESKTLPVVVEAVPDAIFDYVKPETRITCAEMGVEVVPYSLLLPIITCLRRQNRYGESDVQRIMDSLERVRSSIRKVEELMTNSIEKSKTMIENAIPLIREELSSISRLLVSLDTEGELLGTESGEQ
ncbi:MAG: DNA recombination protein RmuC [Thermoplasmata archaeon]